MQNAQWHGKKRVANVYNHIIAWVDKNDMMMEFYLLFLFMLLFTNFIPRGDPRGKVENVSSVSPACRKKRLNGAVSRNNRIKRLAPCRFLDGHVKEPYEMYIYGVGSPTVGKTFSSVSLHIYVLSHI